MGAGDPAPYIELWLDSPDGAWGPIERGHNAVTTTITWVGSRFSDGAWCRTTMSFWSGDLACTAGFERGEVRIDGGDPSPMTIRVTHVLRHVEGKWWLGASARRLPAGRPRAAQR